VLLIDHGITIPSLYETPPVTDAKVQKCKTGQLDMPKTEITVTMSVSIRDRLRLSIGVKITVHVIVRFSLGLSFSHFT